MQAAKKAEKYHVLSLVTLSFKLVRVRDQTRVPCNHTTTVLLPFFRESPGWARARRKLLLDFMVLGRITRGRHTDNPGGRHSIWTIQQSTSVNPIIFMPFVPQPSQFILTWDRHRNMLDCIPLWLGSRLPCKFGADPFSGSWGISHTKINKTTDWRRLKQNLGCWFEWEWAWAVHCVCW